MLSTYPTVDGHPDCRIFEAGGGEWVTVAWFFGPRNQWIRVAYLPCETTMDVLVAACEEWKRGAHIMVDNPDDGVPD